MEEFFDEVLSNITNATIRSTSYGETDSLVLLVPLSFAYVVIFVFGILGNTATCVVIARNRSMHTATNFYLFSLAISDLMLLVCGLPFELYRLWNPNTYPFGEASCVILGLASETAANATVLTITAFTSERYIAICKPFMSHQMSKLSRVIRFIVVIWILALCLAAPQAIQFGIVSYEDENGEIASVCTVKGYGVYLVFIISSCLFFLAPMTMISVLYGLIAAKLRTSRILHPVRKPTVVNPARIAGAIRYKNSSSQKKVVRMLVAVALSFFVCWAPFHLQRLLAFYGKSLDQPSANFYQAYIVLTYLSGTLYFLSTAINPFLYSIMSNKFRNAFKATFSSMCKRPKPKLGRTYSELLASKRVRSDEARAQIGRAGRRVRRPATTAAQLYDAPPRAQCFNGSDLGILNEVSSGSGSWSRPWRQRRAEPSDSAGSPRSISNSSLREVDEELTGEELATYMYQVNYNIGGLT